MFGNVVKLVFQSASIGSGLDDFIAKTKTGLTNPNALGQGVAKLSTIFGGLGASIGGAVNMLLHGGVWGAAAEGVKMVIGVVQKWRAEAALAAEENASAFAKVQEKAKESAEQMKSAYQKSNELIDAAAKKKLEDIELTKKQAKAELELAAAKAKAAGKEGEAAALARQAAGEDQKTAKESAKVTVEAAQKKLDAAKKQARGLPGWENNGQDFKFDAREWEKQRRARNGRMMYLRQQIKDAENQNVHESRQRLRTEGARDAEATQGQARTDAARQCLAAGVGNAQASRRAQGGQDRGLADEPRLRGVEADGSEEMAGGAGASLSPS